MVEGLPRVFHNFKIDILSILSYVALASKKVLGHAVFSVTEILLLS